MANIKNRKCSIHGCNEKHRSNGWCSKHYRKLRVEKKTCSIEGCDRPFKAKGWCNNHYEMNRIHGHPLNATRIENGASTAWLKEAIKRETDECILWPFGKNSSGYGQIQFHGKPVAAHRVGLIMHLGGRPNDFKGLHCCHAPLICHNRLCVNPRHLRMDTPAANCADSIIDGTSLRGERSARSKLSEDDVRGIRELCATGNMTSREIGAVYGVAKETVAAVKNGVSWSWLV